MAQGLHDYEHKRLTNFCTQFNYIWLHFNTNGESHQTKLNAISPPVMCFGWVQILTCFGDILINQTKILILQQNKMAKLHIKESTLLALFSTFYGVFFVIYQNKDDSDLPSMSFFSLFTIRSKNIEQNPLYLSLRKVTATHWSSISFVSCSC